MKATLVRTKADLGCFYSVEEKVYHDNPFHRSTETDLVRLLVEGPSDFHNHASVYSFLLTSDGEVVGRFAVIHDQKLPNYVQVSFFEALPGLDGLVDVILAQVYALFPKVKSIVIGLNGHVNYGAGFLLNRFDEAPVFGLPYTPAYYIDYFAGFSQRRMASFRDAVDPFVEAFGDSERGAAVGHILVRHMNRRRLKDEVRIYTYLNNECFQDQPYWANRTAQEDIELFNPFRSLLREENLLFAEMDGKPVGFLLWYPDFNQLVNGAKPLGIQHVLQYRLANPITALRFTEIGVLPHLRKTRVTLALLCQLARILKGSVYTQCEGGFIFEENFASNAMTQRMSQASLGRKSEAYRRYAVFECDL